MPPARVHACAPVTTPTSFELQGPFRRQPCLETAIATRKCHRVHHPRTISMRATENSMPRPSRTGMIRLKRMMAAPTIMIVSVWPIPPERADQSGAADRLHCRCLPEFRKPGHQELQVLFEAGSRFRRKLKDEHPRAYGLNVVVCGIPVEFNRGRQICLRD